MRAKHLPPWIAITLTVTFTALFGGSWRDNRAELCFDRPEDNGSMNIFESWVRVSDYRVPLIGGQTACLLVRPGSAEITVTSMVPYDPASEDEEACRSRTLKLELLPNETRHFLIEPATKGPTYICGWHIDPIQRPRSLNRKKSGKPEEP